MCQNVGKGTLLLNMFQLLFHFFCNQSVFGYQMKEVVCVGRNNKIFTASSVSRKKCEEYCSTHSSNLSVVLPLIVLLSDPFLLKEMQVSDNPGLQQVQPDPTLFCIALKKNRFYLLTQREPGDVNKRSTFLEGT